MIPIEHILVLALPMALGLAGAALYHLAGPVLRGLWAVVWWLGYRLEKSVCYGISESCDKRIDDKWYPATPTTDSRLRNIESEPVFNQGQFSSVATNIAKANVRLNALEERMGKVEEPIDADTAWVRDASKRWAVNTCIGASIPGSYVGIGRMTYQQWREFMENSARAYPTVTAAALARTVTYGEDDVAVPYSAPAGQGKPCPKPTKDLRPGDEVSVRVKVKTIGADFIAVDWYPLSHTNCEDLDKLRTDNK